MKVEELNVDERIKLVVKERGIGELWPPQVSAIEAGLLEGTSLVVAASTSSGKTLIAELLMANTLLERGERRFILFPCALLPHRSSKNSKPGKRQGSKSPLQQETMTSTTNGFRLMILSYSLMKNATHFLERLRGLNG